jgi:hypothetical protein
VKLPEAAKNLLANTDDMANTAHTQFVGRIDSAHVCQKQLADMAELADMAD